MTILKKGMGRRRILIKFPWTSLCGFIRLVKKRIRLKIIFCYQRNGTSWSDGDLSMHTGVDDMSLLGKIASWNKRTRTDAFPGDCGLVRGSSDGLFPPGLTSSTDSISIYSTDLCRPLHFTRSSTQDVHGIPVQKFDLAASNFANSSVCAENACYNNNIPSGVQVSQADVSPCLRIIFRM